MVFFLANIPEALSSSAGMRRAGRSARYVFGVWVGIVLLISLAAGPCRARAPRHWTSDPGDGRGVSGGSDPGAGLGNDDPGGIPRFAAVQRLAAGRWFCGLTHPAGTYPLNSCEGLRIDDGFCSL